MELSKCGDCFEVEVCGRVKRGDTFGVTEFS